MECPQRYKLKQVEGWRSTGEATDAEFGQAFGEGMEVFYKQVVEEGADHDTALRAALRAVLVHSWNAETGKPRLGAMHDIWHCTGTTPYKNKKGNKAKCPHSHKGIFHSGVGPLVCGECGSATAQIRRWFPTVPGKDRLSLLRAVTWYTEEMKGSHLKPVSFVDHDGKHRVMCEQSFALPMPVKVDGEAIWLIGWLDAMKSFGDEIYVTDYKTTKHALGGHYFSQYRPNPQVDIYNAVAPIVFAELGVVGVGIEAIQCLADGNRFAFRLFRQSPEQAQEVASEVSFWIAQAYKYAASNYWPRNTSACRWCEFKDVCAATPDARPHILSERFARRRWNPLKRQSEDTSHERLGQGHDSNAHGDHGGAAESAGPRGPDSGRHQPAGGPGGSAGKISPASPAHDNAGAASPVGAGGPGTQQNRARTGLNGTVSNSRSDTPEPTG